MNVLSRGLTAAACAAALVTTAAAPAAADTVNIRIEGDDATLASKQRLVVPASGTFAMADGTPCNWDSIGGAIETVTGGNWDRKALTSTIAGESHTYAQNDWWHVWQNRKPTTAANCAVPLADNDDILIFAQRDDAQGNPTRMPLVVSMITAPSNGVAAEVWVQEDTFTYSDGVVTKPAAGVTVTAGPKSGVTDAAGRVSFSGLPDGVNPIQATAPNRVRSNVFSLITNAGPQVQPPSTPPPTQKDTTAPRSKIVGLAKRVSAAKAPRLLKGTVTEAGGIRSVKLRLTRTSGGKCYAWSAKRERFIRRPKCGASSGWWWSVGDKADWEYQLPAKLPKGRYVLDVKATDRSYNRDEERRTGENRAVFEVR